MLLHSMECVSHICFSSPGKHREMHYVWLVDFEERQSWWMRFKTTAENLKMSVIWWQENLTKRTILIGHRLTWRFHRYSHRGLSLASSQYLAVVLMTGTRPSSVHMEIHRSPQSTWSHCHPAYKKQTKNTPILDIKISCKLKNILKNIN